MRSRRDVDALLFDLGGIVIAVDFNRVFAAWAALAGEQIDIVESRFSFDTFFERHERGEITAREYFAALRSSLGINLSDDEFTKGWNAIYVGKIQKTAELLRRLKDTVPLYAFTNSNPTHQRVFEKEYAEELRSFRKVFVSCEMGRRKPEPEAFNAIAAEIGVRLDRMLFFDDTRENVEGALAVGMQAVHVTSVDDIERNIAEFLA